MLLISLWPADFGDEFRVGLRQAYSPVGLYDDFAGPAVACQASAPKMAMVAWAARDWLEKNLMWAELCE